MRIRQALTGVVLVGALAVGGAACGDDDDDNEVDQIQQDVNEGVDDLQDDDDE